MRWLLALVAVTAACGAPSVLASPTPVASPLPVVELKYRGVNRSQWLQWLLVAVRQMLRSSL